jgi:hypothetical protein
MNKFKKILIIGLMAALPFLVGASDGQQTKSATSPVKISDDKSQTDLKVQKTANLTDVKTSIDKPLYKPPLRGSPAGRVGGGTRGVTDRESFSLLVLAPDHVGQTVKEQPCLYWFISKPLPYSFELTVIERKAEKPIFENTIKGPEKGGIQSVRLTDFGVRLQRNVPYKWFITLVTDAEHRSKDILAGGIITSVEPSQTLLAKLKAGDNNAPVIYAEEGFWYDALETISAMIDASPDDTNLRKLRASLLKDVGLAEVAEYENRQ